MPFDAVVVSGPSGVGKSTLCSRLLAAHPDVLTSTVSHTTRPPRAGEVDGKAYYFVSRDRFEQMIADGAFIEHTAFNGNLYGTSKQTVNDQASENGTVLLDVEMEGVKALKKIGAVDSRVCYRFVFVQPPDFAQLEARLRGRGTEDEASIQRRLARAHEEMAYAQTGVHDCIIVNRDLETAYRELEAFVLGEGAPRASGRPASVLTSLHRTHVQHNKVI